jgi:menaquinone-dependent protoporphyrinogen IX oxidase
MLVICYSRTGTTGAIAKELAHAAGADLEYLADTADRAGLWGYLRSGRDAMLHRGTTLKPLVVDPATYDLVLVGSPVWMERLSAPVRTFLEGYRGRLQKVAFFLTSGGKRDHTGIFREMAAAVGAEPVACLSLAQADVPANRYAWQLQSFLRELQTRAPAALHPAVAIRSQHELSL